MVSGCFFLGPGGLGPSLGSFGVLGSMRWNLDHGQGGPGEHKEQDSLEACGVVLQTRQGEPYPPGPELVDHVGKCLVQLTGQRTAQVDPPTLCIQSLDLPTRLVRSTATGFCIHVLHELMEVHSKECLAKVLSSHQ